MTRSPWLGFALVTLVWLAGGPRVAGAEIEFHGLANASAAVRVGEDRLLVGIDELNVLMLYSSAGGEPGASFDLSPWLGLTTRNGETDIEGAARMGEVTFWIGSHGRNKAGELRPDRHRLVAFRLRDESGTPRIERVGQPVTTLLDQLASAPALARFHLGAASRLAPEEPGGFNIEGLAAGPDGSLLIGLRSPVPEGRALLIPLKNPLEVIEGRPAVFGEAHQLDLEGRGVRDLLWTGREFIIVAGSAQGGGKSRLYRWAGGTAVPQRLEITWPKSFNPEAVVLFDSGGKERLLVLSDDGNRKRNDTRKVAERTFRAVWVELSTPPDS